MLSIQVMVKKNRMKYQNKKNNAMLDGMQIVAVVESDDYGPAVILDPEHISIVKIDGFYIAASRCVFTNQPISCEISAGTASALVRKGVKCISVSSLTENSQ